MKNLDKQSREFFEQYSKRTELMMKNETLKFQKIMRYKIVREMMGKNGGKVLDIGCGVGYQIPLFEKEFEYFGIDFSQNSVEEASKKSKHSRIMKANANNLPFKRNNYDFILIIDALHNVRNVASVLKEANRVLKEGGKLYVSVPVLHSIYGLSKIFFGRMISKGRFPPIDKWMTFGQAHNLISRQGFSISRIRGSFYLPPFFLGNKFLFSLPRKFLKKYENVERTLGKLIPKFGYHIIFEATKPVRSSIKLTSIILPTYNERKNLGIIVERIQKIVKKKHEIIVVDDNSPDRTWELARNLARKYKNIRVYVRKGKRGLARSISFGLSKAKGDAVVWMDCNLGHPPEKIPVLLKALENSDISKGSRYVNGGRDERDLFRRLASRLGNHFSFLVLGKIKDYTAGFVAARKHVFHSIRINENSSHGEYCPELLYTSLRKGFKVTEIPFKMKSRGQNQSKLKKQSILSYLFKIISIRLKRFE